MLVACKVGTNVDDDEDDDTDEDKIDEDALKQKIAEFIADKIKVKKISL